MKKRFLMATAVASALMLSACDGLFGGDEVTVTVTDKANIRDAATTEGSSVIGKLEAGTQLTGKWVTGATDASERWFAYERDGKVAYIWEGNLEVESGDAANLAPRVEKTGTPSVTETDKSQDIPAQNPKLADGIYLVPEMCGAAKGGEKCANESVVKRLCETIESYSHSSLVYPAIAYSMAGRISVPRDAIIHLVTRLRTH